MAETAVQLVTGRQRALPIDQVIDHDDNNDDDDDDDSDNDRFAQVARWISVDRDSADKGGIVGWLERHEPSSSSSSSSSSSAAVSPLPLPLIQRIWERQPKAGDILIVPHQYHPATIHSTQQQPQPQQQQWHVIQVLELWLNAPSFDHDGTMNDDPNKSTPGIYRGINWSKRRTAKLKGQGVLPQFPSTLQTYEIQTVGCQMNVADSERLEGILQQTLGLVPLVNKQTTTTSTTTTTTTSTTSQNNQADTNELVILPVTTSNKTTSSPSYPDLLILNTCSIRDHAEQKLYHALGPYCALKRQGRQLVMIVTGCVAQQEGQNLLQRLPELDVVLGPQYIPFLPTVLEKVSRGEQVVATAPMLIQEQQSSHLASGAAAAGTVVAPATDWSSRPVRGHNVRAWVNVIYGCNEHCTYCVVPATRGMEQSRSMEAILHECLDLAATNYKEITLIGQNIDAYGRDMVPKRTFAELLEFLNQRLPSGMRLRYVTSHPRYFSDRVIDAVANLDKVCECFHMPFQAGDDEVLKRMRRGYTFDSYLKIIDKIRAQAPDAGITADIIVGFPGESEADFQKTLQLMEAVQFDNINSFVYSPRPNTEAALWDDQIPDDVKAERLQRVQALAARHALARSQRYLGRIVEVLVEDPNPRNPEEQVMGRTRQGRQVFFPGNINDLRGMLVNVNITEAGTWSLKGEAVVNGRD